MANVPVTATATIAVLLLNCSTIVAFIKVVPMATKVETNCNYRYANVTTTFTRNGTSLHKIDYEIEILRNLANLKVTTAYYVITGNEVPKSALVSRCVDVCGFLRRPTQDRLLKLIYDELARNSYLPKSCPMRAGHYYIRDYQLGRITMPAFFPESAFVVKQMYPAGLKYEPVFDLHVYGKLVRVVDA